MSNQLRLLEKAGSKAGAKADTTARPLRGRATRARRPSDRRAAHWQGQWRLDAPTRAAGLAGVASARAALAAAHESDVHGDPSGEMTSDRDPQLRRAS